MKSKKSRESAFHALKRRVFWIFIFLLASRRVEGKTIHVASHRFSVLVNYRFQVFCWISSLGQEYEKFLISVFSILNIHFDAPKLISNIFRLFSFRWNFTIKKFLANNFAKTQRKGKRGKEKQLCRRRCFSID